MSKKKKKSFIKECHEELTDIKDRFKRLDQAFDVSVRQDLKASRARVQQLDEKLKELHPAWCAYWRLKKRKEREERKLKHYSY